jgi:transcriptional regulator with XRE-family HTH domain
VLLAMPRYNPALIIAARKRAGYTQTQAANIVGKTASTVARYECGAIVPTPQILADLADAYGVAIGDFYDPADPDDEVAKFAAELQRLVAAAPPLSSEQRTRLRALLRTVARTSEAGRSTRPAPTTSPRRRPPTKAPPSTSW